MKTLVERLLEEADDTHKNWYRVASEDQREQCRALTLEAVARVRALEAERDEALRMEGQAHERVAELEAALLRHGHKDGSCGLCAALTAQETVAEPFQADGGTPPVSLE